MAWCRWARGRLRTLRRPQHLLARHAHSSRTESCIGIDIGGSLCKVAVFEPTSHDSVTLRRIRQVMASGQHPGYDPQLAMKTPEGEYSFLRFESRWMDDFLAILQKLDFPASEVRATGGGAFKYSATFKDALGVHLHAVDEMDALVKGLRFCQQANPDEVFWYDLEQPEPGGKLPWASWTGGQAETPSAQESALVVNIGSGVSVLKVQAPGAASSPTPVQRISGCSVGGATFWGLARLLTRVRSFDEAVELAGAGDNTRVAMLVKDIYGGEYGKLGLPDGLVAADFGKMSTVDEIVITEQGGAPVGHIPPTSSFMARSFSQPPPIDIHGAEPALPNASSPASATITRSHIASEADLTRGLLVLVLNNIAQVAFLNAKAEGVDRIFFTGGFLREGIMMRVLTSALKYWSAGSMQAGFLAHNTYFGAMGALLEARAAEHR